MNHTTRHPISAKPIALTKRDAALFAKIVSFAAMNTDQIRALFFGSLPRARRRLRQLWQAGYLKRTKRTVLQGEGTSKYCYTVTSKAVLYLAQVNRCPVIKLKRSQGISLHNERINDFRVCLELASQRHDPELISWREGRELKLQTTVDIRGIKKVVLIIPDALFTVKMSGREYSYFLEIDRGTTDLSRIVRKCLGYLNLFAEKTPQRRFGIRSFRVLFVTTSQRRIENIAKQLTRHGNRTNRLDLLSFADFDSYSLQSPRWVLKPTWQTIGTDGKTSFSRPLPSLPPSTFPTEPGKPPVH